MKTRIASGAPEPNTDLSVVLSSDLPYKIAVTRRKNLDLGGDAFELGDSTYGVAVDSLLEHLLVGNVGNSEMTTVSRNADFLKVFDICCGYTLYRDQVDPSSIVRKRPNDTVVVKGAVCLKNEAKGDAIEEEVARKELIDKLSPDALKVFPANSQSIFGMTTFPLKINFYKIAFDAVANHFSADLLTSYDVRHPSDRVRFVLATFKIASWMSTISKPHTDLHLVFGVRLRTPNGHHVTWTSGHLLKELHLPRTGRTRAALAAEEDSMRKALLRIQEIYTARLPNVEWGTVELPNTLKVTRVGFMLQRAILAGMISREKAVADVEQG